MPITKTSLIRLDRTGVREDKLPLIRTYSVAFEGAGSALYEQPVLVEAFSSSDAVARVAKHLALEEKRYRYVATCLDDQPAPVA